MTDNPWKKRKSGRREFMPPSRALYAERGGVKGTATWIQWFNNGWKCASASGCLTWMRGMTDPKEAHRFLGAIKYQWHWIEPNTVKVLAPPF